MSLGDKLAKLRKENNYTQEQLAVCFGFFALGAVAIGELSVGNYFAKCDHAYAVIAIGKTKAVGSVYQASSITKANYAQIISLLEANVPKIFYWLIYLVKPLL